MKAFAYERAADAAAAVEAGGTFLAGGTNLVDLMKLGVAAPEKLVDVSRLDASIERVDDGVRIGAAARNADVARDERVPLVLREALLAGASPQLRNVATVGGNLLQRTRCSYFQDVTKPCNLREPGSGCPAVDGHHRDLAVLGYPDWCVATYPGDMSVALVALGATVHTDRRDMPVPGLHSVLEPSELITAITVPDATGVHRYRKVRDRASYAFALVSLASVVDGLQTRLALGSVAPTPWRCTRAERVFRETGDAVAAAEAELEQARPLRDNAFKATLARNLIVEALNLVTVTSQRALGVPHARVEGHLKVTGQAHYAAEHNPEGLVHAVVVQATIARGAITEIGPNPPGVLAVLHHGNAGPLAEVSDGGSHVLQDPQVHYRGQIVAVVVAETLESARAGADALEIEYRPEAHDAVLTPDHPGLYAPDSVNGGYPTESIVGDAEAALARAEVVVDETYGTPVQHNNAMEPHACVVHWRDDGRLIVNESSQGTWGMRGTLAELFGLEPEQVSVHSPHVGGGFGSKGTTRPYTVAAALAAKHVGRPVKCVSTRRQMFSFTGYRTPTFSRIRLGATRDGTITAVAHDAVSQTSQVKEFTEQTATVARVMYGGADRRSTHRVTRLDVPSPSWYRAPGETPGMFALESAMDELAIELGMDPVELRIRNDPPEHPETGKPWSSRGLVACLREGAERFGWADRHHLPGGTGYGVAASMYPVYRAPAWAHAKRESDGSVTVRIAAADIGTGARTVLTQIAADAIGAGTDRVRVELGSSDFPRAGVAGGSMGTASWGSAVHGACRRLIEEDLDEADYDTQADLKALEDYARHAFGAQFAQVTVDPVTGEVTVDRMLGVFAVGRVLNPQTARSQFIGGMTQGLGMALMEETVVDAQFGDFVTDDLAQYHVPVNADVRDIEATWVEEDDPHLNPMHSKGIGEIGITGAAAAIANAVHAATGVRVRRLPIHVEALV